MRARRPDNVLILDLETEKAIGEIDRESSITTAVPRLPFFSYGLRHQLLLGSGHLLP